MRLRPTFKAIAGTGVSLALVTTGSAALAATVSDACPDTMAEAQAMLERQGRLAGAATDYPRRYSPAGLNVLGATPTALTVANEPNALWSFSYELQPSFELNYRRAFEQAPPRIAGFTHDCPASSQCRWNASGFASSGPQPQHVLGQLLQVDLRGSYSNPGAYSLACVYFNRRPVRG
jgi:hypothetical protein